MIKIAHRINTISQLRETDPSLGVEIDLRPEGKRIILHHDPFCAGEDFEEWLKHYSHRLLILNTKAEGMEEEILRLMQKHRISDFFFLDLSLPYMVKYMKKGIRDIAVRFSEYEPLEFTMGFAGKLNWVWVDCFNELPLNDTNHKLLSEHFKLCLVSPELQGFGIDKIDDFKIKTKGMKIDAVCTKRPDLW